MKYFLLIVSLLVAPILLYGQGKIGGIHAPVEVCASEEFVVSVVASALQHDINRDVVIQYPEQLKLLKVLAIDEEGEDTISMEHSSFVSAKFPKEKGHIIAAYEDHSRIYSNHFDAVVYSFIFKGGKTAATSGIKVCLVERGDPNAVSAPEQKKGKQKKKHAPALGSEWRIVAPDLPDEFSFQNIGGYPYSTTVRTIRGWDKNSRALTLSGYNSSASLSADTALLLSTLARACSIGWWYRSISPKQTIFSLHDAYTDSIIIIGTDAMGQIQFLYGSRDSVKTIKTYQFASDGAWHHILFFKDNDERMTFYVDGLPQDSLVLPEVMRSINHVTIGNKNGYNNFQIDELTIKNTVAALPLFSGGITTAEHDTSTGLFALFHFEDFGSTARSSFYPRKSLAVDSTVRQMPLPVWLDLDSNATILESCSPIVAERAMLSVEQTSATKVLFNWYATSEMGVKRYQLQRKIASFGEYEKTLDLKAKQPLKWNEEKQELLGRAMYSAAETLPSLSRDIELYYRLALIGDKDSVINYTQPVKLEFGGNRDVFVDQNKPNPFNPKTTINFRLVRAGAVSVKIYDIMGREVSTIVDSKLSQGKHSIEVDATTWPAGIYFYKVKTLHTIVTKRMVLAK